MGAREASSRASIASGVSLDPFISLIASGVSLDPFTKEGRHLLNRRRTSALTDLNMVVAARKSRFVRLKLAVEVGVRC